MMVRKIHMALNASITANFFLKKSSEEGIPLTIMKLLKIIFIAHGWTMAFLENEEGVLDGECVEAWKFGPVIRSIYEEFKHFKSNPIKGFSQTTIDQSDNGFETKSVFIEDEEVNALNKTQVIEIFECVWDAYKEYSAWELSELAHEHGSPWQQTYRVERHGEKIENTCTRNFYTNFLKGLNSNESKQLDEVFVSLLWFGRLLLTVFGLCVSWSLFMYTWNITKDFDKLAHILHGIAGNMVFGLAMMAIGGFLNRIQTDTLPGFLTLRPSPS